MCPPVSASWFVALHRAENGSTSCSSWEECVGKFKTVEITGVSFRKYLWDILGKLTVEIEISISRIFTHGEVVSIGEMTFDRTSDIVVLRKDMTFDRRVFRGLHL